MQTACQHSGGFTVGDIETAQEELRNWRAWSRDDPNHLGYPSRAVFARYYVAGKAFDETPPERVDATAAERTERIVVQVAMTDFDAHRILVAAYPHGKSLMMLSKQFHTDVPTIKRRLREAEALYCKLSTEMG